MQQTVLIFIMAITTIGDLKGFLNEETPRDERKFYPMVCVFFFHNIYFKILLHLTNYVYILQ